MSKPSLIDLLAGKTPLAMYHVLHSHRLLSDAGLGSPSRVVELMRSTLRESHRQPLEWLARALLASGYLNEDGEQLFKPDF